MYYRLSSILVAIAGFSSAAHAQMPHKEISARSLYGDTGVYRYEIQARNIHDIMSPRYSLPGGDTGYVRFSSAGVLHITLSGVGWPRQLDCSISASGRLKATMRQYATGSAIGAPRVDVLGPSPGMLTYVLPPVSSLAQVVTLTFRADRSAPAPWTLERCNFVP